MRQNERSDLHKQSLARVSKWPNTAAAERERKEYERIRKLEDDEVSVLRMILINLANFGNLWPIHEKVRDFVFSPKISRFLVIWSISDDSYWTFIFLL